MIPKNYLLILVMKIIPSPPGWQPHLNMVASTCAAALTLTNERSTPSLNRREPVLGKGI